MKRMIMALIGFFLSIGIVNANERDIRAAIELAKATVLSQTPQVDPFSDENARNNDNLRPNDNIKPIEDFKTARQKAIDECKPLLIWVNCGNLRIETLLPDYINYHTNDFKGEVEGKVIFGIPDGFGDLDRKDLNKDDVSLNKIKELVGDKVTKTICTPDCCKLVTTYTGSYYASHPHPCSTPVQPISTVPLQPIIPMMPRINFGGFGGGFGGGGGGCGG